MRHPKIVLQLLSLLTASACTPIDAYKPGIDALVTVDGSMSKALDHVLEGQRTDQRLRQIRAVLAGAAIGSSKLDFISASQIWIDKAKEKIKVEDLRKDEKERYGSKDPFEYAVLCEPRWAYTEARNYHAFTTAFVVGTKEATSSPSDKPGELISSILSDWGSRFPNTASKGKNDSRQMCMDDFQTYADIIYPDISYAQPETYVEAASAAISLAEVLYDIFKSAIVQGLQEVDRARRAEALGEWLKQSQNIERMKEALKDAQTRIVRFQQYDRATKLAQFVNASRSFTTPSKALEQSTAVLASKECKAVRSEYDKGGPDSVPGLKRTPMFERCFATLWDIWSPDIQKLLVAAADYDSQADVQVDRSAEEFRKKIDKLEQIANGTIDPTTPEGREVLDAYLQTAVRLEAWAQQVLNTASNVDNKKKIDDAIKNLKDALKS